MDDEILFQGPGYTIARSYRPETLVPYFPAEHGDGNINYGWIDLRERPDQVDSIPEARKSIGLANLLRVLAQPSSKLMSNACECGLFDQGAESKGPRWTVGGFVTLMFKDPQKNAKPENLIELAQYILGGISPTTEHLISYEIFIEPLKCFFDRTDCFALTLKPYGHASTEQQAWASFHHAASAAADAIQRGRAQEERIGL
ncbi:MAG: hypothetical protein PHD48_10160 [Alphaproteobacteria bacterium]|nr:hypothetical protein [Alphaproteobacteria bacterium]